MKLGRILAALVITSALLVGGGFASTAQASAATTTKVTSRPTTVTDRVGFTVKGKVTPARKGAVVAVERHTRKGWVKVGSAKTTASGAYSITAKVTRTSGVAALRVATRKSGSHSASASGTFRVKVQTRAAKAVAVAKKQVGKRYRYGSTGPSSFDCSGLTSYAYKHAGVKLSHSARSQATKGKKVAKKDLKVGDLVFFYAPISHVGMYIGDGKIVHAANPSSGVEIGKLSWMPYSGARRVG